MASSHGLTPEQVSEIVARTRAEQGLPRHVEDPRVLDDVATLLGRPAEERGVA